ncbi:MAG: sugar ABC transporter permease, partial [Spirochaetes bacterium]|nr:sugar ABC transporter permease [Spirochaetota bacterium]
SFFKTQGGDKFAEFVFLGNYINAITSVDFRVAVFNNIVWVIFGPGLAVFFGLVIALLADRSNFEVPAKALIFLPMAISFIGAGIIWKFVYAYLPPEENQIGLLNHIIKIFGGIPENWMIYRPKVFGIKIPINSILLTFILVWMQTGYAMVLLSSAIKGVPDDLLEAARIDGAGEFKIIISIIIPYIKGTIITVTTTIVILTLKVFDIVWSMTGGNYDTDVLATLQYQAMFGIKNYNLGSTYAIILLVLVIPAVLYNLKQFSEREAF